VGNLWFPIRRCFGSAREITTKAFLRLHEMTHEQQNNLILNRWSIFDLRELDRADWRKAEESIKGTEVVEQGEHNLIQWFVVESGANLYEVRRFEEFVFCSCASWFYNQKICKHIAATFPPLCVTCRERLVEVRGDYCLEHAPYIKPTSGRKPERIGGMWI